MPTKLTKGKLYRAIAINEDGTGFPPLIVYKDGTLHLVETVESYCFMALDSEFVTLELQRKTKMRAFRVLYEDKIAYVFRSHVRFNRFSLIK